MKKYFNEQGQTFVIVAMVMLLALVVGISISSRFISGLRLTSRSDSATRAIAVAEASVERLLIKPTTTLEDYISNNSCGSECQLEIIGSDGVKAVSTVTLSFIGNSTSTFSLPLKIMQSGEVNLKGYPNTTNLWVCWNNSSSGDNPSIAAMYVYGTKGSYAVDNYAYNSMSSSHTDNKFSTASSNFGYTNCFTVTGKTNPNVLRLRALYNDASIYIVPAAGATLPKQGVLITALGTVGTETKKVEVIKTSTVLPTQFDYVLYQKSTTNSLSN